MPGMSMTDIGQPKAKALASQLLAFNLDMVVRYLTQPVHDVLEHLNSRYDLIVTRRQ